LLFLVTASPITTLVLVITARDQGGFGQTISECAELGEGSFGFLPAGLRLTKVVPAGEAAGTAFPVEDGGAFGVGAAGGADVGLDHPARTLCCR
jgi:hypothetical protein